MKVMQQNSSGHSKEEEREPMNGHH